MIAFGISVVNFQELDIIYNAIVLLDMTGWGQAKIILFLKFLSCPILLVTGLSEQCLCEINTKIPVGLAVISPSQNTHIQKCAHMIFLLHKTRVFRMSVRWRTIM